MAIDFPNSPALDEEFTSGSRTWVWTGAVWNTVETALVLGPTGPEGPLGPTGPTGFPTGGTAGQIIVKASSTDYDTAWDNGIPEYDVYESGTTHTVVGSAYLQFTTSGAVALEAQIVTTTSSACEIALNGYAINTGNNNSYVKIVRFDGSTSVDVYENYVDPSQALTLSVIDTHDLASGTTVTYRLFGRSSAAGNVTLGQVGDIHLWVKELN
jgi:hypothetical protein